MSLHALAHHMAEKGRGPDSMLVHMSPDEIQSLQALAMANGGSLTINPQTGLPEAGFLDSLLPALVGFGLNAFLPGLGTAVGGIFGLGGAAGTAIAVGGATALASGDLSKGLMAGLGAYGGAGLGGSLNAAGSAALDGSGFVQAPGEAGRMAAMPAGSPVSTLDRLQAGMGSAAAAPGDFLKSNYMNLGFAAAPGMSGAFDEEEASTDPKRNYGNIPFYKVDPVTGKSYVYKSIPGEQASTAPGIVYGNANGGLMNSYAPGGRIEDEYSILPYEPPITIMPVVPPSDTPVDPTSPITDDVIKKGIVWGNVLDPDLTGRDLNDKRSDSEKAQDYLMGKGPNPFSFTSKAPVVDPTKKAAEATKEIAAIVAEQQRGGSGNNGLGPSAGNASSAGVGFPAGLAPAANTVAQALGDMGLNSLSHAVSSAAMSGAMSGTGAAAGSSTGPDAGVSSNAGWGGRDAGGGTANGGYGGPASGATSAGSAPGASASSAAGPASGRGDGGDGGDGGGGDGPGSSSGSGGFGRGAEGGYLTNGQFDQRYADGGTTGSGSLDLHVPINIGGEGGGGAGGGGGFGGGQYQPMGQGGGFGGGLGGLMPQGSQNDGMMRAAVMPQGGMSQPDPDFLSKQMNSLPAYQTFQKAQQDFQGSDEFKNFQNYAQEYQQQFQPQQQLSAFGGTMGGSRYGLGQGGQNGLYGGTPLSKPSYEQYLAGRSPYQQDVQMSREQYENPQQGPSAPGTMMATGGITALADGGMYNLGSYSDGGRLLRGPGDGVSDDIPATIGEKQPARLADGEFVVPARIVSELGNGSTEAGARKLYAMMDRVQKARHKTVGKNKVAANTRAEKYLPA